MKKIRLTCSWTDDKSLVERFNSVYITKNNFDPNFVFTYDDNFDYLVIINWPLKDINFPRHKTLGIIMEPSWSPLVGNAKNFMSERCEHVMYHNKGALGISNEIYYPDVPPYQMDHKDNLDYFLSNKFKKTKLCSIIVTNHGDYNPHPSCLYPQRVNLVKQILQSDLDIDIFGKSWEKEKCGNDERIKGEIINKKDGLLDYKFSVAIENCIEPNYVTEKLFDCILTDTTPIYYGCPNVNSHFKNLYSLDIYDDPVEQIKDIITKREVLDQSENKKLLENKYNLYIAITKYFKTTNP